MATSNLFRQFLKFLPAFSRRQICFHSVKPVQSVVTKTVYPQNVAASLLQIRAYSKGKDRKKDAKHKNVVVDENTLSQVIKVEDLTSQLDRVIVQMKENFVKHLTLRTSMGVLDTLPVTYEGTEYTLSDLAQIGKKSPSLYVVSLSNFPQVIPEVLKAIKASGLNLNPQQDGTTLFIPVPKITKEHREMLAKSAKASFVKTKDELRDVQNKFIRVSKNKTGVSEDVLFSAKEQITKITDMRISEAETILKNKQEELLSG